MHLDNNNVCDACNQAKVKDRINWENREKELIKLLDKHRSKDGSYDCLVPGSGGKDSAYQAHVLKYKYGMNPLTMHLATNTLYRIWLCNFRIGLKKVDLTI